MEHITVRDATDDDAIALAAIWHDGWHDAHATLVPSALVGSRTHESFVERMRVGVSHVRTTGATGAPLGFCWTKHDEVYQLYVSPPGRGRGVAAALLADAEHRMAAQGIANVWLSCAIGNERAARFYEKAGWHLGRTMPYRTETTAGTFELEVWRYEKTLLT